MRHARTLPSASLGSTSKTEACLFSSRPLKTGMNQPVLKNSAQWAALVHTQGASNFPYLLFPPPVSTLSLPLVPLPPRHSSSSPLRSALYLKLLCSSRSHQQDLVFDGRLTEEKFHPLLFWESIRSVFRTQILNLAFLVTCESSWLCWNSAPHIWSVFSYQHYRSLFSLGFMGWKGFFPALSFLINTYQFEF